MQGSKGTFLLAATCACLVSFHVILFWFTHSSHNSKSSRKNWRVLNISRHKGTMNEVFFAATSLGFNVTNHLHPAYNEPDEENAREYWGEHKELFSQFDLVITSDTASLALIFVGQPEFRGKLLCLICNRFDYGQNDRRTAYHNYFLRMLTNHKDVIVRPNCDFELLYLREKLAPYRSFEPLFPAWLNLPPMPSLYPIGEATGVLNFEDPTPKSVQKNETLFVIPYFNEKKHNVSAVLDRLGVRYFFNPSGTQAYGGPSAIREFRALLHLPYSPCTIAMWENLRIGQVYFLPTPRFQDKLSRQAGWWFQFVNFAKYHLKTEWYRPENKDLFVYFDSWEDIPRLLEMTDFEAKRENVRKFMNRHKELMLRRWDEVLIQLTER